jgi:DNA-binding response OmpR family regulator
MGTFLTRLLEDPFAVSVVSTATVHDWLADHSPDLMVLDLDLSDDDAYALLRTLCTHPRCAEAPVLVLSNTRSSRASVRCLEVGASEVLSKPFNPEELCVRLKKLTDSTRASALRTS